MVSAQLSILRQIVHLSQVEVKIKNLSLHHLDPRRCFNIMFLTKPNLQNMLRFSWSNMGEFKHFTNLKLGSLLGKVPFYKTTLCGFLGSLFARFCCPSASCIATWLLLSWSLTASNCAGRVAAPQIIGNDICRSKKRRNQGNSKRSLLECWRLGDYYSWMIILFRHSASG